MIDEVEREGGQDSEIYRRQPELQTDKANKGNA